MKYIIIKVGTPFFIASLLLFSGCSGTRNTTGGGPLNLEVKPICTVSIDVFNGTLIGWNGRAMIADRSDANIGGNFAPFHAAKGPVSNPNIRFTNPSGVPDCYRLAEGWLRIPGNNEVHRATILPEMDNSGSPNDAGWALSAEDAKGTWSTSTLHNPVERTRRWFPLDNPTTPQIMTVGLNNPQLFVTVPALTQNMLDVTTFLREVKQKVPNRFSNESVAIQDLLYGDDHFDPNWCITHPEPLCPPVPLPLPVPFVHGPGDPVGQKFAICAMTQLADDVASRHIHMLAAKDQDKIVYSNGSNFDNSISQNRFTSFTPWVDITPSLGGGFGEILHVAATGRSNTLIVVFVTKLNNRYKLWLTARVDANGTWRAPVDVFAAGFSSPNGFPSEITHIAIGACPAFDAQATDDPASELMIALSGLSDGGVYTISHVTTAKEWIPNQLSNYSPMSPIQRGDFTPNFTVQGLHVSVRPFSDTK